MSMLLVMVLLVTSLVWAHNIAVIYLIVDRGKEGAKSHPVTFLFQIKVAVYYLIINAFTTIFIIAAKPVFSLLPLSIVVFIVLGLYLSYYVE